MSLPPYGYPARSRHFQEPTVAPVSATPAFAPYYDPNMHAGSGYLRKQKPAELDTSLANMYAGDHFNQQIGPRPDAAPAMYSPGLLAMMNRPAGSGDGLPPGATLESLASLFAPPKPAAPVTPAPSGPRSGPVGQERTNMDRSLLTTGMNFQRNR